MASEHMAAARASHAGNGLFKQEVQDSTLLNVKVVNRQETSKNREFIVTLFATIVDGRVVAGREAAIPPAEASLFGDLQSWSAGKGQAVR